MNLILIAIFLLTIAAIIIALIKKRGTSDTNDAWPFCAKKPLTPPEQILYHRLVSAMPEHIILAQVQLSRILGVKKGFSFNEWNNKINRMSLDFVVCLKDSTIVAAIELDDKSHDKESSVIRDTKKDKALSDAGIKIIRWNVNAMPNETIIRKTLTE